MFAWRLLSLQESNSVCKAEQGLARRSRKGADRPYWRTLESEGPLAWTSCRRAAATQFKQSVVGALRRREPLSKRFSYNSDRSCHEEFQLLDAPR